VNRHLIGIGSVCLAGVAFALFAQHMWDMQPCPWCIIQRMLYVVLGLVALICGAFSGKRTRMGRTISSLPWKFGSWAVVLLSIVGVGVAISATGLDEFAPEVFKVRASCADAASSNLLGLPFEAASGLLFGMLLLWGLYLVARLRSN
jgi:protein dithiol:quinone oxidoreductase